MLNLAKINQDTDQKTVGARERLLVALKTNLPLPHPNRVDVISLINGAWLPSKSINSKKNNRVGMFQILSRTNL